MGKVVLQFKLAKQMSFDKSFDKRKNNNIFLSTVIQNELLAVLAFIRCLFTMCSSVLVIFIVMVCTQISNTGLQLSKTS